MHWKRAPITVWSFVALMFASLLFAALPGDPTIDNPVVAVLFPLLWSYVLLRRSTIGWWVITALHVFALLTLLGSMIWPWDAVAIALIAFVAASIALLLAPQTRAWCGVGRRRASPD